MLSCVMNLDMHFSCSLLGRSLILDPIKVCLTRNLVCLSLSDWREGQRLFCLHHVPILTKFTGVLADRCSVMVANLVQHCFE